MIKQYSILLQALEPEKLVCGGTEENLSANIPESTRGAKVKQVPKTKKKEKKKKAHSGCARAAFFPSCHLVAPYPRLRIELVKIR